jgi:hypothetical protein
MSEVDSGLTNNYQQKPVTTSYKLTTFFKNRNKYDYNENENKNEEENSARDSTDITESEEKNNFQEKPETKRPNRNLSQKKIESTNSNLCSDEICFNNNNNNIKKEPKANENKEIKFFIVNEKKKEKPIKKSLFFLGKKKKRNNNRKKFESSRQDNDRTKFVRQVFNTYWYGKLPNIFKKNKTNKIKKFPQGFINETAKIQGQDYLDKSIKYFYTEKKLYKSTEVESYFNYNINFINKLMEGNEKDDLEKLFDIKYSDLINEYLESKEFQKFIESMKIKDIFEANKFKYFAYNFINNSQS